MLCQGSRSCVKIAPDLAALSHCAVPTWLEWSQHGTSASVSQRIGSNQYQVVLGYFGISADALRQSLQVVVLPVSVSHVSMNTAGRSNIYSEIADMNRVLFSEGGTHTLHKHPFSTPG